MIFIKIKTKLSKIYFFKKKGKGMQGRDRDLL